VVARARVENIVIRDSFPLSLLFNGPIILDYQRVLLPNRVLLSIRRLSPVYQTNNRSPQPVRRLADTTKAVLE